ncbi:hypothetical protein BDA99DRAFT_419700, partial [Phascolomyces articulosus]
WANDPTALISRYYTLYFHSNSETKLYVRQAPNKVCILGMTDQHIALLSAKQQQLPIQVTTKVSANMNIKPGTVLCEVTVGDSHFPIEAHMYGKFLEINPRLLEKPELLLDMPMTEGYLAVIKAQYEDTTKQLEEF